MNRKQLAQAVIDKYGEETQRLMMIEEMAELTVAVCHVQRGRFCSDQVAEEVADCLAVLDSMDILFEVHGGKDKDVETFVGYDVFLSLIGDIQCRLCNYLGSTYEKQKISRLLSLFRLNLSQLINKIGKDRVGVWQKIKHDRMIERLSVGQ